jgi:hypothetical protein
MTNFNHIGKNPLGERRCQNYSNEGHRPCPREDNPRGDIINTENYFIKIFFSRTDGLSSKLDTNHPLVKEIENSNKEPGPLQRGDNCKNGVGSYTTWSGKLRFN